MSRIFLESEGAHAVINDDKMVTASEITEAFVKVMTGIGFAISDVLEALEETKDLYESD